MTVSPLEDPKRNTWYYGVRCECKRLLALCEDCFHGKTDDAVLPVPIPLTVQCPCGGKRWILQHDRMKSCCVAGLNPGLSA